MSKNLRATLLAKGEKAIKDMLIPLKIKKDEHKLTGWILDREGELSSLELKSMELKADSTLRVDDILDILDSIEIKKVRIQQGKELYKELFEDEVKEITDEDK